MGDSVVIIGFVARCCKVQDRRARWAGGGREAGLKGRGGAISIEARNLIFYCSVVKAARVACPE